jgi:hypothetical protein
MRQIVLKLLPLGALCCAAAIAQQPAPAPNIASSLGLFVYPSNNQSPETQNADMGACYSWAQQATGITNPNAPPPPPPPPQQASSGGGAGRGMARGAAKGALIADIADEDTSEAAAVGAVIGGARGARQAQAHNQQAQQQAQAAGAQQAAATKETFNKAFTACLEGKQYTVK